MPAASSAACSRLLYSMWKLHKATHQQCSATVCRHASQWSTDVEGQRQDSGPCESKAGSVTVQATANRTVHDPADRHKQTSAECTEQQTATNLTQRGCSCSKLPQLPQLGAPACPQALPRALAPLTAPFRQHPLPAQQVPRYRRGPAGGCCRAHCRSHWSRHWTKCSFGCPRQLTHCHRHWGARLRKSRWHCIQHCMDRLKHSSLCRRLARLASSWYGGL